MIGLYDYRQSTAPELGAYSWHARLASLIRDADTFNLQRLESQWPDEVAEMRVRYNAPGGLLPGERDPEASG